MLNKLHPRVKLYLDELLSDTEDSKNKRSIIKKSVLKNLSPNANNRRQFIIALNTLLGNKLSRNSMYPESEVENLDIYKRMLSFRELLKVEFNLVFPNTYQCCAFLLIIQFSDDKKDDVLSELSPNLIFFNPSEFNDEDGNFIYDENDRIDWRLIIDWCPYDILTNVEIIEQLLIPKYYFDLPSSSYSYNIYSLFSYYQDCSFEALPVPLKNLISNKVNFGSDLIDIFILLLDFPNIQSYLYTRLIEYVFSLNEPNAAISKILKVIPSSLVHYEEMVRHVLAIDGLYLRYLDEKIRDNDEFVAIAIQSNPFALSHASERIQSKTDLIENSINRNPQYFLELSPAQQQNLHWLQIAVVNCPDILAKISLTNFDEQTQLNIWEKAILASPRIVQLIPEQLRLKYPHLFKLAIEKDERMIIFSIPADEVNREQLINVLTSFPLLFCFLPEKFRCDREILSIVVSQEPLLYRFVPDEYKSNKDLVNIALDKNLLSIIEIYKYVIPEEHYIREIIRNYPYLLPSDYLHTHFSQIDGFQEFYFDIIIDKKKCTYIDVRSFEDEVKELSRELFIPTPSSRISSSTYKNAISRGINALLKNIESSDN